MPADPDAGAVSPAVRHFPAGNRFQVEAGGPPAVLEYELRGKTVVFTHTEVPEHLRGRGIAEALVRAGLGWAEREGRSVEATCSYVARFLERNKEFDFLRRR